MAEDIHSDDGCHHIRLGAAIQEPKDKARGVSVAVYHATLLRPRAQTAQTLAHGWQELSRLINGPPPVKRNADTARASMESLDMVRTDEMDLLPPQDAATMSEIHAEIAAFGTTAQEQIQAEEAPPSSYEAIQDVVVKVFKVPSCTKTMRNKHLAQSATEIKALSKLTAANCQHNPSFLGYFDNELTNGDYVRYILMTRLPGQSLAESLHWQTPAMRRVVKAAFDVAIEAVHACGVDNGSAMGRNCMFDPEEGKVYIVDSEKATFGTGPWPSPSTSFELWASRLQRRL